MGRTVTIPNSKKYDHKPQSDCVNTDAELKVVFTASGNLSIDKTSGKVPGFPKGRHNKGDNETHTAPHVAGGEIDWTFIDDNGKKIPGTLQVHGNDSSCEDPKEKEKRPARKAVAKEKKTGRSIRTRN